MTMTTATRTRKQQPRTLRLTTVGKLDVLWLTAGKLTTAYKLTRLPSDFGAAYRLDKAIQGDGQAQSYDVCLLDGGRSTCECLGHLHHKTECKHIASLWLLTKQGKLEGPKPAPETSPAADPFARVRTPSRDNYGPLELDDL
jgi:hypothetical protein